MLPAKKEEQTDDLTSLKRRQLPTKEEPTDFALPAVKG